MHAYDSRNIACYATLYDNVVKSAYQGNNPPLVVIAKDRGPSVDNRPWYSV